MLLFVFLMNLGLIYAKIVPLFFFFFFFFEFKYHQTKTNRITTKSF